jgi:O-antigen/teichoic acid export membrane protein
MEKNQEQAVTAPSLGQRARRGTVWYTLGYGSTKIVGFAVNIILARLLGPTVFGLMGMAAVFSGLVTLFGGLGVGSFLVHQQEDIDGYANAAFRLNVVLGFAMAVVQVSVAPFVARFYNTPIISPILMVSAIGYLIGPLGSVHATLLTKEMEFKKTVLPTILTTALGSTITIVLAVLGFGVWSFVISALATSPVSVVINWILCPWRPSSGLFLPFWKKILDYGKHFLGWDLLEYLIQNTDYLLVGRILGATGLGLYVLAFSTAKWVETLIAHTVSEVTFPAFAKLQKDQDQMRDAFLKTAKYTSILTFPAAVGLLVVASQFIPLIYGTRWSASVIPLQLLLAYGFVRSITRVSESIPLVVGRPDIGFKWDLALFPILALAVWLGSRFGLVGVATSVALVLGGGGLVWLRVVFRLMGWRHRELWKALWPALFSSLIMAGLVYLGKLLMFRLDFSKLGILAASIVLGAVLYFAIFKALFGDTLKEFVGFGRLTIKDFRGDITEPFEEFRKMQSKATD